MNRPWRRALVPGMVLVLLSAGTIGAPRAGAGAVIHVDTTTAGVTFGTHCSLQEAIYSAEFGDNIALDATDPDHTYTTGCEPGTGTGDTIELPGGTLQFDDFWEGDAHNPFGPTATPIIFKPMTIVGNGTTLEATGPKHFRLFAVGSASITPTSGVVTGTTVFGHRSPDPHGRLCEGFSVKGGDGADGGGGGLGAGGAIYVGRQSGGACRP